MKAIKNLFKKNKTYCTDNKFIPLVINEDAEFVHDIFGITDKRSEELAQNALDAFEKHSQLHLMLIDIISYCKHANEIALSMMLFERIVEKAKVENKISTIMSNLFGGDE